jgi:hypothetical protein
MKWIGYPTPLYDKPITKRYILCVPCCIYITLLEHPQTLQKYENAKHIFIERKSEVIINCKFLQYCDNKKKHLQ